MASERSTARINYDLSEMSSTDRRGIGSPVARKDYVDRRRRQAQGQARAKAEGRYKGRPEDVDRNTAIGRMLASKQSWGVIQSVTGYSRTIIAKIAKRLKPAAWSLRSRAIGACAFAARGASSLYKYLDVHGAKLTLGNRTFKQAKPSDFNDTEDLTIQSIFPEELEAACKRASEGVIDVIAANLDTPPACASPMKEQLVVMQAALRADPSAVVRIKAEIYKAAMDGIHTMEQLRETAESTIRDVNAFMQGWRVLCVTTHRESEKMWSGYAENHKGIALRIEANAAKDSKFQSFQPAVYRAERPPLHDDVLEFVAGSLFGDRDARYKAIMEKIIYAKTLAWRHEGEYARISATEHQRLSAALR
jgi:hypothetical protein